MSEHGAEMDAEWTGCVHCGQTLPHEGAGWRESSRCRLFQSIAEQAWDEGFREGYHQRGSIPAIKTPNPYRVHQRIKEHNSHG